MADLTFSCPSCGEVLEATDDLIGERVQCPTCETEFEVSPDGASVEPDTAGAAADDAAKNVCPNCDAVMLDGAVLCLQCGFHTGIGKVIETNFG
jgi:DNA-directed RNA polymerase subunit M/transcription elongation factor TFIIS